MPIAAQPGQGYSLMEGYFLPPFPFTGEEATMLLFGSGLAATHFDAGKIEAVFSNKLRDEGKLLKESIHLVNYDVVCQNGTAERLREIRGAILDRKTIRFRYHTRYATGGKPARGTRARPIPTV